MKITILNGNSGEEIEQFDNYLNQLSTELEAKKYTVSILNLREMDIKYCTGCFSCWVKTPGECLFKDDSGQVCRSYINSDLVVFASPKRLRKRTRPFYELGRIFGRTGRFDDKIAQRLARPERLSAGWRAFMKFLDAIGLLKMGWNFQLKQNNAYKKRNDTPYAE